MSLAIVPGKKLGLLIKISQAVCCGAAALAAKPRRRGVRGGTGNGGELLGRALV